MAMNIYLALGDKKIFYDRLDQCLKQDDGVCDILKVEPLFDGIRNEPRFQAVMKKANLIQ